MIEAREYRCNFGPYREAFGLRTHNSLHVSNINHRSFGVFFGRLLSLAK